MQHKHFEINEYHAHILHITKQILLHIQTIIVS